MSPQVTQPVLIGIALVALTLFAVIAGLDPVLLGASVIVAAQPLLLAALGELVVEKSGVLNLGVEGMMILGAIGGFATAVATGSPWLGFAVGALAGAAISMIFGVLTQFLLSNQVATGLALTLFGLGLAALLGQSYAGLKPPSFAQVHVPVLSDLPVVGPLLLSHDPVVYLSLGLVTAVWYWLTRTRAGMVLRAVGENHDAAHALGYRVVLIRLGAIAFGGALAGLGGAYLSLVRVPQWNEGMTAGAGWIALAIVVFGGWNPWRVLLGALLFGGVTILQLNLQAANLTPLWLLAFGLMLFAVWRTLRGTAHPLSILALWLGTIGVGLWAVVAPLTVQAQYMSMTPYLVTIVVLTVLSADRVRAGSAPANLGKPFHSAG